MNKLFCVSCFLLLSLIMHLEGGIVFEAPAAKFQDGSEVQWQELGEIISVSSLYVNNNVEIIGFYYTLSNNMRFLDEGSSIKGNVISVYAWKKGDLLFITSPMDVSFKTPLKIYNVNFDESRTLYRVDENCNPFDPFGKVKR